MCQQHLDGLRGLIEASGYGSLIVADGEEADRRLSKELQESAGPDDFDPLMAAQNLNLGNAIDVAGTQVLGPAADGSERCPICYLEVPQWVEYAARDAIEQAKTISPGPLPPSREEHRRSRRGSVPADRAEHPGPPRRPPCRVPLQQGSGSTNGTAHLSSFRRTMEPGTRRGTAVSTPQLESLSRNR